jgi:AcrR family transcriptional regulator
MLEAMVSVVAERGYGQTTIVEVAAQAGVARKTFYEHFGDLETCFLEAYVWLMERLRSFVAPAWEREGVWVDRVRRSRAAILTAVTYRPEGARFAMVEAIAAGPRARQQHREAIAAFAPYVDEGRDVTEFGDRLPGMLSRVVTGGAASRIASEVAAGRADQLRRLRPELLHFVLLPYVGPERAWEEVEKDRARLRH